MTTQTTNVHHTIEALRILAPIIEAKAIEIALAEANAKVVAWADVPVGIAVCDKKTNVVWLYQGGGDEKKALVTAPPNMPFGMQWIDLADLAPAKNQPWIAYQGAAWTTFENVKPLEDKGFIVESEEGRYRIAGLAEGYEMENAK